MGKCVCMSAQLQRVPTLCRPVDCSPPSSSVHGILQARILEGVAFPYPGDLPDLGIKPRSPALQADALTSATREDLIIGDWNAKVGSQEIQGVKGKFALGV